MQNVLKDAEIALNYHQLYLELLAFNAKNSIDSTSASVQYWPKYLPYRCVVI